MRLREFSSAEDQIALWRLISNTVWTSIEQQRMQQQQAATTAVLGKAAANLPARRVKAVRRKPAVRKASTPPVVSPAAKPATAAEKTSKSAAAAPQENKQADKQPSRQQNQQLSKPPATLPYIYQSNLPNQPNQVVSASPSAAVNAKSAAVARKSAPAAVPDKRTPRTAVQAAAVDTVRQRGETGQETVKRR
jgi:hypothetical protein